VLQTFSHPCTPSLFGTRHLLECTSIFEIIIPHWNRIIKQLEYVCAVPNTMGRGQSPGDMHACMHKWLPSSRKKMIVAMWSCAEGCSVISRLTLASCSEPATLRGVHTFGTSVTSTGTSIKKSAWFWMLTYSRRGRCSSLRIASRICCSHVTSTPVPNNTKRSLLLAPTILPLPGFGSVSQVQSSSMVRLQTCRSAGDWKSVKSHFDNRANSNACK